MAEKDIIQKSLEGFKDVFADIVNGFLFNGEEIVSEDSLEDTTTISYYKAKKIRSQDRDVAKFWNNGQIHIALFGFENQTHPEKEFLLRVIGYDGAAYRSQLSVNDALKRNGKPPRPLYPVITLVLYFGTDKHWNHPLHLRDCFQIPAKLDPYVSDYTVNLFEVAWLTDEQVQLFKSDFRLVAEYLTQMRKNPGNYIPSDQEIVHVREFFHLMSVMTGNQKIEDNYRLLNEKKEGGKVNMRDYFTIMFEKQEKLEKEAEDARKEAEEAREEAEEAREKAEEAREEAKEAQKKTEEIQDAMRKATIVSLKNIMLNFNVTIDKALDVYGIAEDERELYKSKL